VTDAPAIYMKARADVAAMLGYDVDALSPEQATRLDVATALRVLLDNQSARLVRGESLDARELLMASDALSRLLPPLREPPPASNAPDARQIMWETYKRMRDQGAQFGIGYDGLKLENERLRAELAALKGGVGEPECSVNATFDEAEASVPGNVVKLSPRNNNPSPPAATPQPAPQPQATGGLLTDDVDEPWRSHMNRHYDRWADNRE
jgi:hypothetical protein